MGVTNGFERAVLDGIGLLRALPRHRTGSGVAREGLAAFRREHPEVQADLVTDWSGGPAQLDYDLLLRDEAHGTLALSNAPGETGPWSVEHAEHWAAQRVLTVDGVPLTVHDALRLWQARAAVEPGAMDELLDQALLARVVPDDDGDVGTEELQRAANAIRRRLGLHGRTKTMRWLEEHGLSLASFEELARRELRLDRWLDRMFDADGVATFEEHRGEFERIDLAFVYGAQGVLEGLREEAASGRSLVALVEERLRSRSSDGIEVRIERRRAWELPGPVREATPLLVVGPLETGGRLWLAQVISRSASELDDDARRSVRSFLRRRWLDHARAAADIRWHWL